MANERILAITARQIAAELAALPKEDPYPFGEGRVFMGSNKAPCCAIGHVIARAGLSALAQGRESFLDGKITFRSSGDAMRDVCGVEVLTDDLDDAVDAVVAANDAAEGSEAVAEKLYRLADALEEV